VQTPSDQNALQQQLQAAHAEEVSALQEAVALLKSGASSAEVEASYRRCELARTEKNRILRLLGKLGSPPR
jgi:hypothetical protein